MALNAEILTNNYGVPLEFSKKLMEFTKGDLEAAIKLLEASEKDMIALKIKFISNKSMSNGGLLYIHNTQTGFPEYVFGVVSADSSLSRAKLENNWKEFYLELCKYQTANESDPENASKIEAQVLSPTNINYLNGVLNDRKALDIANIKRFFVSEISKVLYDTNLILKLMPEEADVFRVKGTVGQTRFGTRFLSREIPDWIILINLQVDPILAPIGGIDIEKINLGDEVLVRLNDTREEAKFALGFLPPESFSGDAVYGKLVLKRKSAASENTEVMLEFGCGIYCRFLIGGKVRLQARLCAKPQKSPEPSAPENPKPINTQELPQLDPMGSGLPPAQETSDDETDLISEKTEKRIQTFWIIGGIILVALIILIWALG